MKILVATNMGGLDDNVSMVFARAPTFTIIETDGKEIKNVDVIPNQFANAVHGAGIQVGQYVASMGVNVAIAGNFGPNVSSILSQSGIQIVTAQGRVRDVVEDYLAGRLGMTTPPSAIQPVAPPSPPMPPSMGRGDVEDRIKRLEEEIAKIEDIIEEIRKEIESLKEEK